jgi:hypothetical protein
MIDIDDYCIEILFERISTTSVVQVKDDVTPTSAILKTIKFSA